MASGLETVEGFDKSGISSYLQSEALGSIELNPDGQFSATPLMLELLYISQA